MLTTGEKKFGLSGKLSGSERHTLSGWLEAEAARPDKEYGLIVRTNAAQAEKAEILQELSYLKSLYEKVAVSAGSLPFMASRLTCTRIWSPGRKGLPGAFPEA